MLAKNSGLSLASSIRARHGTYHEDFRRKGNRRIEAIVYFVFIIMVFFLVVVVYNEILGSGTSNSKISPDSPNTKTETFLLPATVILTSPEVTRNIGLQSGQTLTGNYGFNPDPNADGYYHFLIAVTITDPQGNIVATFGKATQDFSLTAASSGIYIVAFGCTTSYTTLLPRTCSVTWTYTTS